MRRTRSPGGGTTNVYPGADFQYLSTNVVRTATGETLFPAYATKRFKSDSGKKFTIGFLGEVLESTPTIVTPTGVAGLTFQDEADAANNVVSNVKTVGNAEDSPDTWVLVIHEGGFQSGAAVLNGCAGNLAGSAIEDIAKRLDPRDQGDHLRAHARRVPLHDHDDELDRRDGYSPDHQRLVVRSDPQRHHAHDRRQDGRARRGERRRTPSWTTP